MKETTTTGPVTARRVGSNAWAVPAMYAPPGMNTNTGYTASGSDKTWNIDRNRKLWTDVVWYGMEWTMCGWTVTVYRVRGLASARAKEKIKRGERRDERKRQIEETKKEREKRGERRERERRKRQGGRREREEGERAERERRERDRTEREVERDVS